LVIRNDTCSSAVPAKPRRDTPSRASQNAKTNGTIVIVFSSETTKHGKEHKKISCKVEAEQDSGPRLAAPLAMTPQRAVPAQNAFALELKEKTLDDVEDEYERGECGSPQAVKVVKR
jgi:hypothetical protein